LIIHGDHPLHVADAVAWQRMLKEYRIEAFLREKKKLRKSDLSGKDFIIVGTGRIEKTKHLYIQRASGIPLLDGMRPDPRLECERWREPEVVKMLRTSGLPIVGIGESGQSLFSELNAPVAVAGGLGHDPGKEPRYVLTEEAWQRLNELSHIRQAPGMFRDPLGDSYYTEEAWNKLKESSQIREAPGTFRNTARDFSLTNDARKYLKEPYPIDEEQWTFGDKEGCVALHSSPSLLAECILEDVNKPPLPPIIRFQKYVSWCGTRDPQEMSEASRRLFANIAFAVVKEEGARSDAERAVDLREQNYHNSLEYYELFCLRKLDMRKLQDEVRGDKDDYPVSAEEVRQYMHLKRLEGCTRDWSAESPDAVVSPDDRKEVDNLVGRHYPRPGVRRRGQEVTIDFYGGNRCRVDIVYNNGGPLAASGYYCYLIKYQGKWVAMRESLWQS
jgi:hypothetical protein